MNIDQLISDADPAANFTIPGPDSPLARHSLERALGARQDRRPGRRRRFTAPAVAIGAVAAAAAAITVITSVTPGVPVAPASAASVLNEAAAAAGRQKPLVLRPGEYLYTKIRSLSDTSWSLNHHIFYPVYTYTDGSWLTAPGTGEEIMTVSSPVTFSHNSRAEWIAAGRPPLFAHNPDKPFVSWYTEPKPGSGGWIVFRGHRIIARGTADSLVPLENLSRLPTSPAALARAITHHKTGLASINADVVDPSSPAGAFYAAMEILSTKSVGGTPALRSALFKVMAEQPGIKLTGRTTTRSGRAGTGLVTPPDHGVVFKVIIDPATGQVLETDEYVHGLAEQWTEYLTTAVVSKAGQPPHPS